MRTLIDHGKGSKFSRRQDRMMLIVNVEKASLRLCEFDNVEKLKMYGKVQALLILSILTLPYPYVQSLLVNALIMVSQY